MALSYIISYLRFILAIATGTGIAGLELEHPDSPWQIRNRCSSPSVGKDPVTEALVL